MKPEFDVIEAIEYGTDDEERGGFRLRSYPSTSSLESENFQDHSLEDFNKRRPESQQTLSREAAAEPTTRKLGPFHVPAGWRFTIFVSVMTCTVSFLLNLLVTTVALTKYGVDSSGRMKLYEGSCKTTERVNTGLHIFINVMSTVMLSSSNYVMQCLCAVTREEVDAAHAGKKRSRWADIGVPSMFNICLMDRRRVFLWYMLLCSSLPLHLFYNSAVFSSTSIYASPIVSVNNAFITSAQSLATQEQIFMNYTDYTGNGMVTISNSTDSSGAPIYSTLSSGLDPQLVNGSPEYLRREINVLEELNVLDCMKGYAQNFQTAKGGLFLVLDVPHDAGTNSTDPVVFDRAASWGEAMYCGQDRFAWICAQSEHNICSPLREAEPIQCIQQLRNLIDTNISNWNPLVDQYPVTKCYAQKLPQQCKVQASLHLICVVLFLNAVKAITMYLAVRWMRGAPLLTVGDAVASFLERPDPTTKGLCLISRKDVFHDYINAGGLIDAPRVFTGKKRRWFSGSGTIRQVLIIILLLTAIGAVAYFYKWGLAFIQSSGTKADPHTLWTIGIGMVNPTTTISFGNMPDYGVAGLVWSAFVANVPQLILSLIYFTYNGILTSYFVGAEWQSYMNTRKGLRVSYDPRGDQRSTYFLQLPYRAALPLMVVSGVLHWLVSQAIFLVDIESFVWDQTADWEAGLPPYRPAKPDDFRGAEPDLLTCGYSPIPMIFVIMIVVIMLVILIGLGAVPFNTSMPVASSNSLAIAAACHLEDKEFKEGGVAVKKIRWGATGTLDKNGVGHCCFSSHEVEDPTPMTMYA